MEVTNLFCQLCWVRSVISGLSQSALKKQSQVIVLIFCMQTDRHGNYKLVMSGMPWYAQDSLNNRLPISLENVR